MKKDNITITLPTSEFEQIRKALMIRLDIVTSNIKNGNATKEMETEYVELTKISAELQAYVALNKLKMESQNEPKEDTTVNSEPINLPPDIKTVSEPNVTRLSIDSSPTGLIYNDKGSSIINAKYNDSFQEDVNEGDFAGKDIKEKTYTK